MDNQHRKADPGNFAGYMESMVQLEALERMTQTLDSELEDSQKVMLDIKAIFDSIHACDNTAREEPAYDCRTKYEDITEFYNSEPPKLLLPDMAENNTDIDLDAIISSIKAYAEDLKKNFVQTEPRLKDTPKKISKLDLEQYASSLDLLNNKRLANIKLSKKEEFNNRNPDLEVKLSQLCQDVNKFIQMVQTKTTLSESNKNWTESQHNNNALYYDNNINKLLSGINEVTYLLHNKN